LSDVLQDVFLAYRGNGRLNPVFRFASVAHDPVLEMRTQYEESDLAFVERLLADAGLFYWFEHEADDSDNFGRHTLVIADSNEAFATNRQPAVRFHRAAAVEREDVITEWQMHRGIAVHDIALASWNERDARLVEARLAAGCEPGIPALAIADHPGVRHFASTEEAEHAARRQSEALAVRGKTFSGQGTVRTFAPATCFMLRDHPVQEADRMQPGDAPSNFAIVEVRHYARNNLASAQALRHHSVLPSLPPTGRCGEADIDAHKPTPDEAIYSNRFIAIPADMPWRPLLVDGRGALRHPKPTVTGLQTAIVVGHAGDDLTTDRDHRVKVQMHWQRGTRSQTRLDHPCGDDNAPGNGGAYVWVRVATPLAGLHWGTSFLPRIGQEVIVSYLDGDIDRPVINGCLYNGRGRDDAQGNRIAYGAGPATGNAPAWFAGNGHAAILSGFKTQEIGFNRHGTGGGNALIFDDTSRQTGVRLHTTQARTQLNLGHIKRQADNVRQQSHGHGVEMTTQAHGALRAGKGLLISADGKSDADREQMDSREARHALERAHMLQSGLADRARKHSAHPPQSLTDGRHAQPENVLARTIASLSQSAAGRDDRSDRVPAFGRPDAVIGASSGITLLTPDDAHAAAGDITLAGGRDVGITAGTDLAIAGGKGIAIFTAGDSAPVRGKAGDTGIRLHAACGTVDIRAHNGSLAGAANDDVSVVSSHDSIEAAALSQVMLSAGGAYVRIAGGNIEIHAPGKVTFNAPLKRLDGPTGMAYSLPSLPKDDQAVSQGKALYSQRFDFSHLSMNDEPGFNSAHRDYAAYTAEGNFLAAGRTDEAGLTDRIFASHGGRIRIALEAGEWQLEERFEEHEDEDAHADEEGDVFGADDRGGDGA
jgi:type VI secretion system secreted protein VgrG